MPKESTELFPEHGDSKVGYKVFTILAEIIQDKNNLGLPAKWNRNYELSRNKHWAQTSDKISLMTANLLFTHRQRTVNMLTDNNPTFNIVKRGNPDEVQNEDVYDDLLHIAEFWWGDTEQQSVLEKSVQNGETYGCTIEKVIFNPDLEFNLGEVETEIVDPYHFGFYPVKSKDTQKAEANFHYRPMSVREAKRRWPEFADDITSDDEFLKELGDTRREVTANTKGQPKGYFSTFGGIVKNMLNLSGDSKVEGAELLICECWVKDYTTDDDGIPLYKGNIRTITACNGGKIVLEDRSNPSISETLEDEEAQKTYLYDKFPFTLTQSITDTSLPWGVCYDDKTEILTKERGFVLFSELLESDEVATRSGNKEFGWQKPIKYTDEAYEGEMFHFQSVSMNLCVTPNHNMLVSIANSKKEYIDRIMTAEELANGLHHERKIPVTSKWISENKELGKIVFLKSSNRSKDIILSGDDYCALLGAYLAEGSIRNDGGIEIAQQEESKGCEAYKDLCDRIGNYHYDGRRFSVWGKTLKEHFEVFGKSYEKYIPTEIKNLPKRQLEILWDYFVLGDGCFRHNPNVSGRNGGPKTLVHISTVGRRLADDLVEIGQKLGWSVAVKTYPAETRTIQGRVCDCREYYVLTCRYSHHMGVKLLKSYYNGRIYCVTVPNSIIYVRRNGKPAWCGNSDYEQLENLQIEVNKTLTQFTMFKDKVAGFKFINPITSGVSNSEITNRTGILNPSNDQAALGLKYIDPPKMPADLVTALNLYKEMFFLISGSFELEAAQTPGKEVVAYKAIAALIEHASNMLKGKDSNYGRMERERGRMFLSHVMNFYTEDRWIPVESDGIKEQRAINGRSLLVPAKLMVVSGSTLLKSKVVQREEALALFDKGAIDAEELLKKIDWSDWKQVVKRMQAGPFDELFEKLSGIGVPPEIIEVFQELSQMDMKDFEKDAEKGEVPSFMSMVQSLQGEEPPKDPMQTAELEAKQAELGKIVAEQNKLAAETELIIERINSERNEQQVKQSGVSFDRVKLDLERAEILASIEEREGKLKLETAKLFSGIENDKKKVDLDSKKIDNSKIEGKSAETHTKGFTEKGMKSNNVQQ